MSAATVSIVIPVLDEERSLPTLLDHLAALQGRWEVVVADGDSSDGTRDVADAHPSRPRVVCAPRGRAQQMNEGARRATGDVLVFLHADTLLPADAYEQITVALSDPRVQGGNFRLRFDSTSLFARVLSRFYAVQRRLGIYYGDSAIWLRHDAFVRLGGYRDLPIMEDHDLARRLERYGATRCLPGPAVTSARRWQRLGLPRTIVAWTVIRWLYYAGVSPARLAALYRPAR